ncbi:hypothetical protein SAMN05216570_3988 [Dyella sp. OK004]|uniref:hypothetical protein n=1 Tax=Dyella sp. OK004 TaxID=1855292 RepID=UPI0008EC3009|nr:hypothetical protein [Dyella sp. OK004]SFS19336.1 hypothetical protein SAMN05216570_3988 [Dyella sp. OK004]
MALLATLFCIAGTLLLYLASPQQRLRTTPLPAYARWSAVTCVAGGLAAWIDAAGVGPGIMAALTTLMIGCVVLPYLAWRVPPPRERGADR